ncbi:MAG: hypothetical protein R3C28_10890 [Pirellulaceae bacterium]
MTLGIQRPTASGFTLHWFMRLLHNSDTTVRRRGEQVSVLVVRLAPDSQPLPGDSNHDGIFNSSDIVLVFSTAKYEDNIRIMRPLKKRLEQRR